jgi:ketosteroid isomerase-like protein
MRTASLLTLLPLAVTGTFAHAADSADFQPEKIIAIERAALNRWGHGDPQGYIEIFSPDITYFDQTQEKRVDGLEAMRKYFLPITGKVKVDHYEMIGAKVQRLGDMAVLSFNLVSYGKSPDGATSASRWNATEVYGRVNGPWRILHSHWSLTKPAMKGSSAE